MDQTDAIALVVLVIILANIEFTAPTQSARYIFAGILLLYLVLYVANKVSEVKKRESDKRFKWKDGEAYKEAFAEDVDGIRGQE